jgi:flagellar motor protein MotB
VPYSQLKNIVGYAYDYPVADNNTAAGRAQNRRVDILLYASAAMINAAENGTLP